MSAWQASSPASVRRRQIRLGSVARAVARAKDEPRRPSSRERDRGREQQVCLWSLVSLYRRCCCCCCCKTVTKLATLFIGPIRDSSRLRAGSLAASTAQSQAESREPRAGQKLHDRKTLGRVRPTTTSTTSFAHKALDDAPVADRQPARASNRPVQLASKSERPD